MEDNPMTNIVRGILFDYLGNRLTKKTVNEISTRIIKGVLMTRQGLGLPPEGVATNFSDTEVRGDHPEMQPKEVVPEVHKSKKGTKAIVAEPEKEKPKDGEYRTKAIIATPGYGDTDPNNPHDIIPVGPVAYKTKK